MRNERAFLNHPLQSHPEFSVVYSPGYQEYRLENKELNLIVTLRPFFISLLLIFCLQSISKNYCYLLIFLCVVLFARSAFFQLLFESVILFPPHGIQLEVHYGFPGLKPLFCNRQFIPSAALEGAFINEGLKRWNVLYFLTVVRRTSSGFEFHLAYKNLLPSHPILLETFEGMHQTMLTGVPQGRQKVNIIKHLS